MENEEEEELVEQPVASVQVPVHMSPASSSVISEKMPSDINSGVIEIATPEEIRQLIESTNAVNGNRPARSQDDPDKTLRARKDSVPKFDTSGIHPEFQPWPSLEEVKERRERMQKREPLPLGKAPSDTTQNPVKKPSPSPIQPAKVDVHEYRPPVPVHRKIETTDNMTESFIREDSPTKRFRISVSPTKTVKSTDKTMDRITMVRQSSAASSLAPSTQNLAGRDQNENPVPPAQMPSTSAASKAPTPPAEAMLSPRAPRVEFGEDDSPRVQF
ncbi:hypothetical protein WR25_24938 [Diploscapter pachys]|uniref:Uncharacterized protein n=1 Tax=Diploscapter pachys TaxID=2018661 RepID=A0A2A2J1V3_9BILA|nr:hypothetical protein WR25_24938 [Diploscapter pachys]